MMFENEPVGSIRAMEIDEEIWFLANDVAVPLGYKDPAMTIQRHVKPSQKTGGKTPPVNSKQIWAINGGGLYSIRLKRCITREVLWFIKLLDFIGLAQKDAAERK